MTNAGTAALLRLEVGRLRGQHSGGRFDAVVRVGHLGAGQRSCRVPFADPLLDPGTRTEVVLRLLETEPDEPSAALWLTRPGEPTLQDDDLAWLAAAGRAFDAVGRRLEGVWSVTRTGWLDVRTGERRVWKRLRL